MKEFRVKEIRVFRYVHDIRQDNRVKNKRRWIYWVLMFLSLLLYPITLFAVLMLSGLISMVMGFSADTIAGFLGLILASGFSFYLGMLIWELGLPFLLECLSEKTKKYKDQ